MRLGARCLIGMLATDRGPNRIYHVCNIVLPGEDLDRLASALRPAGSTGAAMLTPGERRFRKALHIVIALLLATTAVLVVLERLRGSQS